MRPKKSTKPPRKGKPPKEKEGVSNPLDAIHILKSFGGKQTYRVTYDVDMRMGDKVEMGKRNGGLAIVLTIIVVIVVALGIIYLKKCGS